MKVKLKTRSASAAGCFDPGAIVEVDSDSGKHLIETGQAEKVADSTPVTRAADIETAEDGQSVERAARTGKSGR